MLKLQNISKGDSNPGSLDCESGVLPLSHHVPTLLKLSNTLDKKKNYVTNINEKYEHTWSRAWVQ